MTISHNLSQHGEQRGINIAPGSNPSAAGNLGQADIINNVLYDFIAETGLISNYLAFDFSLLTTIDASIFPTMERGSETACTPRQLQVLDGLERGVTNKSIALALGISERAVKAHVKELMRRLKANNRTQVVALASYISKGRSTTPPPRP